MEPILDFILHIDHYLTLITSEYGSWTYAILFLIIFAETGLVAAPFLPGDSLLFAAGAICALGTLDIGLLIFLLSLAAVLGDAVNYFVGARLGPRVFSSSSSRWLNRRHLDRTHQFYEKHGGKTIILARFMPFIRTFAPFVAGIGKMTYPKFAIYNVVGGLVWVSAFSLMGFYFGNQPAVKENFTLVIGAIILISVIPIFVEIIRAWLQRRSMV
ncbi:MAG: DedA family protein [Ignavibacteria bacterium]|nr:DedA family protein [Ignavibacteria bacterium]